MLTVAFREPETRLLAAGFAVMFLLGLSSSAASASGSSPQYDLFLAVESGDLGKLRKALDAGVNPNRQDRQGWTALMHAVNKGNVPLVKALVEAGSGLEVRAIGGEHDGATVLFMAVALGQIEIVELLAMAGCDVNAGWKDGHVSPLSMALESGHVEISELLIAHGAQINARD